MAHEILQLTSVHETKDRGYSHVAKVGKTLYIAGQAPRAIWLGKGILNLRLARCIPT